MSGGKGMPESEVTIKKLRSAGALRDLMARHFQRLDEAARDPGRKVAWCTSVGPAELLRAFGYEVFFPENHGAMIGATRRASKYIPLANAIGYSPEVCSYMTSDVGAFLAGETPLSDAYPEIRSVPKPDILLYNTNQCREVQDWFHYYARTFDVPVAGVHTPRSLVDVSGEEVEAVALQFRSLVPLLEENSGNVLSDERLAEVVELSHRAAKLWREVLELAAAKPAPITFFDMVIQMAPIVVMRGTEEAVRHYEVLKAEIEERIAGGVAAVEGEQVRVYWDGMPVWGKLRPMALLFMRLGASVVASTYCNSWILDTLDPARSFESMAETYSRIFICRSETIKESYIVDRVKSFGADGILFHNSKTCPYNSNSRHGMPARLKEAHHIPSLVIDGDLNDLSMFNEAQARTRIEAFIEMLRAGRRDA